MENWNEDISILLSTHKGIENMFTHTLGGASSFDWEINLSFFLPTGSE